MIKCLNCELLNLQAQPKHANVGLGKCHLEKMTGRFTSIERQRECSTFKQADGDVILKRAAWIDQRKALK